MVSVTLGTAYQDAKKRLSDAGIEDAAFDAKTILFHVIGKDPRLFTEDSISAAQAAQIEALLTRRCAHEPLQYLCGKWDFLDFTLKVGSGVLIPRADTEVVCLAALTQAKKLHGKDNPHVVDLCSGTGAIAIAISTGAPNVSVTAVELSGDAMPYLRHNCGTLAPNVRIVQADIFEWQNEILPHSIDVLVSNPPYITHAQMQTLAPELAFEPKMALEAEEDGLAFYQHIARNYKFALKKDALLAFEIGSEQGKAVMRICAENGYTGVTVLRDLAGLDRAVLAWS